MQNLQKVLVIAATQTPTARVNPPAMALPSPTQNQGGGGSNPPTGGGGGSNPPAGGGGGSNPPTGGGGGGSASPGGGGGSAPPGGGGGRGPPTIHQIVVANSNVGRFKPFDPEQSSWNCYYERLDQFFIANDVVGDNKKRALLITSLSADQYRLLTNFFSLVSPTTIPFDQLC